MVEIYLVRHGEVHNPEGIIYGHLPGFGLSVKGREQVTRAAALLEPLGPFQALYASPLQRAQESAAILSARLGVAVETESRLVETGIGGYQGRRFEDLPRPYITEEPVHEGIEAAVSIRGRFLDWARAMEAQHPEHRVVAVSHRDPIAVALLFWLRKGLEDLPGFELAPGGVYQVRLLSAAKADSVKALG